MTELRETVAPIDMMLFCPKCGLQHIDAPDERTPDWTNPPHRSHLCHGCGCIWRPADVPTNGVAAIQTRGSKDTVFYNVAAIHSQGDGLRELDMCAHGADRGSYCGYCGGYSKGAGNAGL